MAITVNAVPTEGYKYIPQAERDSENPFTVFIKPIDTRDLLDLEDKMVKRDGEDVYISQGIYSFKVLQQGLVSWSNIIDGKGKDIKLVVSNGVADPDLVANIPADIITEIAGVISSITRDPASIQIFFPEDK